jgi:hypothetical protein
MVTRQSKRLRPICIESDNIWREIQRLFRQEPVRVLSVGEHIMKYHEYVYYIPVSVAQVSDNSLQCFAIRPRIHRPLS